jgi:6-phosphogluconolactonase
MTERGLGGHLIRSATPAALAEEAASWLAARLASHPGPIRLALSGGETPRLFYQTLARSPHAESLPWSRIEVFWGDERFVPPDHPASNFGMARTALLAHVPIPEDHIHPFPVTARSPEAAVAAYAETLAASYGGRTLAAERPLFDVVFLGLGEDGHIASLLPGDPLLEERTQWVGVVRHGRPEIRLTLTFPPLESTRAAVFFVTGARKRPILARLRAPIAEDRRTLPVLRYHPAGELFWFIDDEALSLPS